MKTSLMDGGRWRLKNVVTLLGGVGLFTCGVLLGGVILKLLWNWIMTYLFGLPTISIPMAVGIIFLVSLFIPRK